MARSVLTRLIATVLVVAVAVLGLRVLKPEQHMVLVNADFAQAGLNVRPGYEVRVRDMPAGTIKDVKVNRNDFSAAYTLAIDPAVPIAKDTRASLVPKTLFGDKYVALDPAEPGQPTLHSGDTIDRDHTRPPTEIQQVFDQATPILQALDPPRFGAALGDISSGLAGEGDDLRRLTEGWSAAMDALNSHQADLHTLLTSVPGVAGTFAERSQQLADAAKDLGAVSELLAKDAPELGPLLQNNAKLATQAADLLVDAPARLGQIIPDMVDVVAMTEATPGRIAKFAKSVKYNLRGTADIMSSGWIQTRVTNTFILNWGTLYDAPGKYGDYNGGNGVTPDIDITGMPNKNIPINLSPSQQAASDTGLDRILSPLAGGGK